MFFFFFSSAAAFIAATAAAVVVVAVAAAEVFKPAQTFKTSCVVLRFFGKYPAMDIRPLLPVMRLVGTRTRFIEKLSYFCW